MPLFFQVAQDSNILVKVADGDEVPALLTFAGSLAGFADSFAGFAGFAGKPSSLFTE